MACEDGADDTDSSVIDHAKAVAAALKLAKMFGGGTGGGAGGGGGGGGGGGCRQQQSSWSSSGSDESVDWDDFERPRGTTHTGSQESLGLEGFRLECKQNFSLGRSSCPAMVDSRLVRRGESKEETKQ